MTRSHDSPISILMHKIETKVADHFPVRPVELTILAFHFYSFCRLERNGTLHQYNPRDYPGNEVARQGLHQAIDQSQPTGKPFHFPGNPFHSPGILTKLHTCMTQTGSEWLQYKVAN